MGGVRALAAFVALFVCVLSLNCSGKSAPPIAPQEPDPVCSLSTTNLIFGAVIEGLNSEQRFSLTNTGGGTLSGTIQEACSDFGIIGVSSFDLGPAESSTFTVRFAPANPGAVACSLRVGQSGCVVRCTGEGSAIMAGCTVSPLALDFGTVQVGQVVDRTFTIRNSGGRFMRGAVSETCDGFSIPGSASYSLTAGDSSTFIVRFSPTHGGNYGCSVSTGNIGCGPVACTAEAEVPLVVR